MSQLNYKNLAVNLPFDISVEALAASLLQYGADIKSSEQLLIRPLGPINRLGGNEVLQVSGSVFNAAGEELIYLDINREGLYDTLPEMLFIKQENHYEDEVEKARHLASQTEAARRFLLPFEESLYRTRIDLEVAERESITHLSEWLLKIYSLNQTGEESENHDQMLSLALVLPFVNQIAGNLPATASLLAALLRQEVRLTPTIPALYLIPEEQQSVIGSGLLGVDLLLGDLFQDGIRALNLTICEVAPAEIETWLPGGTQRHYLEEQLLPLVLPAGEQVSIQIEISPNPGSFQLSDNPEEMAGLNILGYTTILN